MNQGSDSLVKLLAASEPVVHPLGFVCFPLRAGLCAHVWLPDEPELAVRTASSLIHCHSWDLESRVLRGRIRNRVYRVLTVPGHEAHYRCYTVHRDDHDQLEPTDQCVRIDTAATATHAAGQGYRLPAGVFHDTLVTGGVTVTLLEARDAGGQDVALGPVEALRGLSGPRAAASWHVRSLAEKAVLESLEATDE
jgi:hypothetical protein